MYLAGSGRRPARLEEVTPPRHRRPAGLWAGQVHAQTARPRPHRLPVPAAPFARYAALGAVSALVPGSPAASGAAASGAAVASW